MKKLILLSLVLLTVFSCGDEVQFNSPAIQGTLNNQPWRAKAFYANIDESGLLTITGINNAQTLELILPTTVVGDYALGNVESMEAKFIAADGTVYSTNNFNGSLYPDFGEIRLTEILNNTFTGTFRFNAYSAEGDVVNFTGATKEGNLENPIYGGIFYKVPLLNGTLPSDPIVCEDVEILADDALMNFQAATSEGLTFINRADYVAACSNYVSALNVQRNYCGDVDEVIETMLSELNNCDLPCDVVTANTLEAESQHIMATIGNYNEKCAQYLFYLQEQIEICGDEDGSFQSKIEALDCADDDSDGVPNVFEDFNGDGDKTNDDTDGDGVPNYLDNDDDGDGILTQYEAVDENGNPVDTDGDMDVDYLDNDDDGDGILTINENADPNGDGNPDDALDANGDGIPDYLQA
ncbi:DUF6252 family protein [Winogradskyella bathintestinalis]|uniref:DUF6252 family protein n=1 Tax=Winogradskyella bathintestinalis TaxID=3035208 RepID=A0ABT7ZQP6_9FLAO|nr:DUF6252 family protein [Winogradskyella bathintestinalis]MDN3491336.1 DUF6252 family protein [Winogradskyella bathintestinalis]